MKNLLVLAAIVLLFSSKINAQNNINGNVLLSNGDVAVGVTITLNPIKTYKITNENGIFKFTNLKAGTYTLTATAIGLQQKEQVITLTDGQKTNLSFVMETSAAMLNDVEIYSNKQYLKNKVSSSFRTNINPFESPQQIQIITSKLIKDQQAFTPTDLAKNVSGVVSIFPFPGI